MRVALMIEGQEDVTWDDWVALADTCESCGIEALFRSDHYLSVSGHESHSSLDAWATINALAARTSKLRLGTLVSPSSFRHPSVLAKLATTADHVSGGRIELGLGTGWSEIEHTAMGFPFLSMRERMDVMEEQLTIIHDGHWGQGVFDFDGEHYRLQGLESLPKPVQRPHPPLVMGGQARPRAARLAARFADEYNTTFPSVEQARERRARIERACSQAGRPMMPFSVFLAVTYEGFEAELARLREFAAVGVDRVYFQHLRHRDLETVEMIGRELAPAAAALAA